MNDEPGKIWKGAVMAYLRRDLGICLERLRKKKNSARIAGVLVEI
jgi:hypothetical protein